MPEVGQHVMTLRLPEKLADRLALVAQLDEATITDTVVNAIVEYIGLRVVEPEFRAKARNHITDVCQLIGETDA